MIPSQLLALFGNNGRNSTNSRSKEPFSSRAILMSLLDRCDDMVTTMTRNHSFTVCSYPLAVFLIPQEVHPTFFADDLKFFSDEIPILSEFLPCHVFSPLLQNALDILLSWSNIWQLPISLPKCSVLSISNSKSPKPRIYSLGNTNLPQVRSCSDLGVLIDDKLTFTNHILSTTKKAYTQSAMMSRCFLSKNPHLLIRAFTSFVRPILEYASPV